MPSTRQLHLLSSVDATTPAGRNIFGVQARGSAISNFALQKWPQGIYCRASLPALINEFRPRILWLPEIAGRQDFFGYFLGHKKVT
jgi:hypothetical protein